MSVSSRAAVAAVPVIANANDLIATEDCGGALVP
jgi:hypothetical protein